MIGDILKTFFGNISGVIGTIIIIVGIFALFFAADKIIGIVLIVVGILLISVGAVLKK